MSSGKIHKYSPEEREFFLSFSNGHSYQEIMEEFNRRFPEAITAGQVKSYLGNNKLSTGRTGRFEKGHVPANKGTHPPTVGRMAETQFKKGHMPHNTKPLGYERISRDGYIEVKVRMRRSAPGKHDFFVPKHRLIWEEAHGPIPEGCNIMFLDGNKQNLSLENLAIVSKAENLEMTRKGLRSENAPFTQTGILIAKSVMAARDAKRKKQK